MQRLGMYFNSCVTDVFLVLVGFIWFYLVLFGFIWFYLALFGFIWFFWFFSLVRRGALDFVGL
jgi:hypothetical protein